MPGRVDEHERETGPGQRIAARAGASKVTVYAHFADKQALFGAVCTDAIAEAERAGSPLVEALAESTDLPGDLRAFAREHVSTVTRPHLVQLRRTRLTERGLVRAADPLIAAQHLNYLILSRPLDEATFAVRAPQDQVGLEGWADQAVRVRLAAYAVRPRSAGG